jgi:hypothetical protein
MDTKAVSIANVYLKFFAPQSLSDELDSTLFDVRDFYSQICEENIFGLMVEKAILNVIEQKWRAEDHGLLDWSGEKCTKVY